MIYLTGLQIAGKTPRAGSEEPGPTLSVAGFSADRVVFDSGLAFGRDVAVVPVRGSATEGEAVEVRALSLDDGGAMSTAWQPAGTAGPGGLWQGTLAVARATSWMRIEARLAATPAVTAQSATRFAVGHVIALWGADVIHSLFDPAADLTAPPVLADDDAVQLIVAGAGGAVRHHIAAATPLTAAATAMADVLQAFRPGEKFALVCHAVPATTLTALVDDAQPSRPWSADLALHAAATADGQTVGLAVLSWFEDMATLGAGFAEAVLPLIAGVTVAGSAVSFPAEIAHGAGGSFHADHWWGEIYDPAETKWHVPLPQRFDHDGDLRDATHLAGGAAVLALENRQAARLSLRAMLALPQAAQIRGADVVPLAYAAGRNLGGGTWGAVGLPAPDSADGAQRFARMLGLSVGRALTAAPLATPVFDQCHWASDGSHVEVWSSGAPITTTRLLRSETAPVPLYPHWSEVLGFQVNGLPATASIVAGRVRVQRGGGPFVHGDVLTFGEGGATGMLQFPDDLAGGLWKDLPVVALGQNGIDALAVAPLPSAAVLANTLAPATPVFNVGATGPYFYDPATIGAMGQFTAVFEGTFDTPAGSGTLCYLSGGNLTLTLLSDRRLRVFFKDSGNTTHVNQVTLANPVAAGAGRIVLSVDLVAAHLRVWVNGVLEGGFSIGANSGAIAAASRRICLLATITGATQATGSLTRLAVWKSPTATGTDPAGAAYHTITGPAATANADGWKLGANATG